MFNMPSRACGYRESPDMGNDPRTKETIAMNPHQWSQYERLLVETLTCKVTMLRESDARTLRRVQMVAVPRYSAAIARLIGGGLVERFLVNLHPPLAPKRPIVKLGVGKASEFAYDQMAQRLKERWRRPAKPTIVLVASRRACNLFGSTAGRLPDLCHRNHDALLGEVFVRYMNSAPKLAHQWRGEHIFPKAGFCIKDPDAFLFRDQSPYRIVESGGSYNARQLESLVDYASEHELELEVW